MPDYNAYVMSNKEKTGYYCASVLALLLLGQIFYQSLLYALLLTPLSLPLRRFYARYLAEKRKAALGMQFRDLLHSLSASFATGRQMPEALREGREALGMIYADDAPMMRELEDILRRLYESREEESSILEDFAGRSHDEDIQDFIDAYFICRATGGDLETMVVKTAGMIVEKMGVQREIRVMTAQKRLEAKILMAIPAVILFFLQLFSPDYIAVLYETAAGRAIMTLALGVTALSYLWSLRLTRVEF